MVSFRQDWLCAGSSFGSVGAPCFYREHHISAQNMHPSELGASRIMRAHRLDPKPARYFPSIESGARMPSEDGRHQKIREIRLV